VFWHTNFCLYPYREEASSSLIYCSIKSFPFVSVLKSCARSFALTYIHWSRSTKNILSTKCSDNAVQPQQEHNYSFGMWSVIFLKWGTLLGSRGSPLRTHTPAREMDPSEGSTERLSIQTPTQVETKPPPPTHTLTRSHTPLPVQYYHYFRYKVQMPLWLSFIRITLCAT
jgi:hypothetical protein